MRLRTSTTPRYNGREFGVLLFSRATETVGGVMRWRTHRVLNLRYGQRQRYIWFGARASR